MDLFQDISIFYWDICGAFGRNKRRHVRYIIQLHRPSLFLIYETHGHFANIEPLWNSLGYKLLFIQEARSHYGGIWVLSCKDDLAVSVVDSTNLQVITFAFQKINVNWYCSAVYASPIFSVHCNLWDHLSILRSSVQGPWIGLGDMNEILHHSEVSGGSFSLSRATLMANMKPNCDFIDLDTIGGFFTWRKNIQNGGHIRKKLDKVMVDIDWRLLLPHALVEILPLNGSDHNPILLSCKKSQSSRAKFFRFQAAWIDHPDLWCFGGKHMEPNTRSCYNQARKSSR